MSEKLKPLMPLMEWSVASPWLTSCHSTCRMIILGGRCGPTWQNLLSALKLAVSLQHRQCCIVRLITQDPESPIAKEVSLNPDISNLRRLAQHRIAQLRVSFVPEKAMAQTLFGSLIRCQRSNCLRRSIISIISRRNASQSGTLGPYSVESNDSES